MEFKIDLLKKDSKRLYSMASGIIISVMLCVWIISKVIAGIRPFDWVIFGLAVLCSIFHFVEALGFSAYRLFGKAYIVINSECILLKAGVLKKEQSVDWDNIKSIDYNRISEELRIEKKDNTNMIVGFYKLGRSFNSEIKETINCIAKDKEIQFVF